MNNYPHLMQRVFNAPLLMRGQEFQTLATGLVALNNEKLSFKQSPSNTQKKPYYVTAEGWAVIPVIGALAHRHGQINADCMPVLSYEKLRQNIDFALQDKSVNLILFEFDSGGGEAAGCFDLANYVFSKRGNKPFIAYVNEAAYSAAYALASACDQIFMTRSAGVGSVGVIHGRLDQTAMLKQKGVNLKLFTSGAKKADGHPCNPLTTAETGRFQARVDSLATEFYQLVARNRDIKADAVKALQAGCFYNSEALQLNLADGLLSQDELHTFLINNQGNNMLFRSSSTQLTQADVDKAVTEATTQLTIDAQTAVKTAVTEQMTKLQTEEKARLDGILGLSQSTDRYDLIAQAMAEGLSVDEAKAQLVQGMSDASNSFAIQGSFSAGNDNKNYLLEACQQAAEQAVSH